MGDATDILATIRAGHAVLEALEETGSVLSFTATGLTLGFTDDDPDRPYVCGLAAARVFTDSERMGDAAWAPHLQRRYENGHGRQPILTAMRVAKADALRLSQSTITFLEGMQS